MADKSFKISSDPSSAIKGLNEILKVMKQITQEGLKIPKALAGLDITKNVGMTQFAKSIKDASKGMKDLTGMTEDTGKVMKNVFERGLKKQQDELDATVKKIKSLNSQLNELRKNASDKSVAEAIAGIENQVGALEYIRRTQRANLDESKGVPRGGGGSLGIGIGQGIMAAGAIANGIASFANQYQGMKNLESGNLAQVRSFEDRILREMMGGNFTTLYAMTSKNKKGVLGAQRALNEGGGTGAPKTSIIGSAAGDILSTVGEGVVAAALLKGGAALTAGTGGAAAGIGGPMILAGGGMMAVKAINSGMGAAQSGYGAYRNLKGGTPEAIAAMSTQQSLENYKKENPLEYLAVEYLGQNAEMWFSANKALQGRGKLARNIGVSNGLTTAEALGSAMGISRQIGSSGLLLDSPTKRWAALTDAEAQSVYLKHGAMREPTVSESFSPGFNSKYVNVDAPHRWEAAADEIQKGKFVSGNSLFQTALDYEKMGFSREGAAGILSKLSINSGDVTKGSKQLEDIMSRAVTRGMSDGQMVEKLGSTIAQYSTPGFDSASLTNMLLAGVTPDANDPNAKARNLRILKGNELGVEAMDRMGQIPFFDITKMAIAGSMQNLNALQLSAIEGSSLSELATGNKYLRAAGIDLKLGKKIAQGTWETEMNPVLSMEGMEDVREFAKKHGMNSLYKSKYTDKTTKALKDFYKFGSYEEAEGVLRVGAEIISNTGAVGNKTLPKQSGSQEEEMIKAKEKIVSEILQKLMEPETQSKVATALAAGPNFTEISKNVAGDFQSMKEVMDRFIQILNTPAFLRAVDYAAWKTDPN